MNLINELPEKWIEVDAAIADASGDPRGFVCIEASMLSADWLWPSGWTRGRIDIFGPMPSLPKYNGDTESYMVYRARIIGKRQETTNPAG